MKRLVLWCLAISVGLLGACAEPVDESLLSADEAPDYIWAYLRHSLPEGYREADFQTDTKTAVYQGEGIWTFTVDGADNELGSEFSIFGDMEDMNLAPEVIETMKSTLYVTLGGVAWESVYDYCIGGNCRGKEVIERKRIAYQLKLTADFDETQAVLENIVVDKFDEKVEAEAFLLLPVILPCGCHEGFQEIRIK